MQTINMKDLILANEKALADGTLLALDESYRQAEDPQCVYEYGRQHCAIGCCLNRETLDAVLKAELNIMPLETVTQAGVIHFSKPEWRQVAALTQDLHDSWLSDAPLALNGEHKAIPKPLHDWASKLSAFEDHVTEKNYREWIALLRSYYIEGAKHLVESPV